MTRDIEPENITAGTSNPGATFHLNRTGVPSMPLPQPVAFEEMIGEVSREIALRERLYPKWIVTARTMSREEGDRRLAFMRGVLELLYELKGHRSADAEQLKRTRQLRGL